MFWANVKLIFFRELKDQLRDKRTLFAVVVLPLLLYPLLGVLAFQVQQFLREHKSKVRMVGAAALTAEPALLENGRLVADYGDPSRFEVELLPAWPYSYEELAAQSRTDIRLGRCDAVVY